MPDQINAPSVIFFPPPSGRIELGSEVHVWRAQLDLGDGPRAKLEQTLSADERARAGRFHFEKDRHHYIAGRGSLRAILGRYLDLEPDQVRFSYNAFGKPGLDPGAHQSSLHFNLAHSHGLALFAFNRNRQVGIDVEWIRPDFATHEIALRFFSPPEVSALCSLPSSLQPTAFFNCWTRKEAFIKARGLGLSLPLDRFVVTLAPDAAPALLSAQGDPQA